MTSSSQQHCRSGRYYHGVGRVHCNHLPHWNRKPKTDNLKLSFSPELKAISYQEMSAVHQKMKGLNCKSVTINGQIRKGGLHSILFDNISNKAENQILGVILDACNHFVRKNRRDRRYITFSSGLNGLKANIPVRNESCDAASYDNSDSKFSGFRLKKKYNFCLVALLALAMCFFVSCGSKSSSGESVSNFGKLGQECYPNKSCDGELTCDEETNRCIENPENPVNDSDTDKPSENNDGDKPVEHNDNDNNPIEEEDKDTPVIDNDNLVNDDDPIENNDNDGEPTEITDNDIPSDECAPEAIIIKSEEMADFSQEEIQGAINNQHNMNGSLCYGSFTEKIEKIDTNGNLCVKDECHIGPNDIAMAGDRVWIDNLPFLIRETSSNGLPPPGDIVYYRKVEQLNKGNPTDFTINGRFMTVYAKGIPTVSCFAPNNVVDNASTITMTPTTVGDRGCYADGQLISPSDIISTKNIQPKITFSGFEKACTKVPNSQFSVDDEKCSTTITEFAWLENVVPYLYNQSGLKWYNDKLQNTKIEYDLNNNVFRMYFSVDGGQYSWVVELPNAKRCLDECYGIDGCEVSITPTPDVSKGCIVKKP